MGKGKRTLCSIERVLDRLSTGGWYWRAHASDPSKWMAQCPAHPDSTPSLSLCEAEDGKVLMHCFAGCPTANVLAELDLTWADINGNGRSEAMRREAAHTFGATEERASADGLVKELTVLLGLDGIGRHVTGAVLWGRGSDAVAQIHLDDGSKVTLDPLGKFATVGKLTVELALQTGAAPTLKSSDITRVMVLLHRLAEHREMIDSDNRAADFAISYLQNASAITVRMSDQGERWGAFDKLHHMDPISCARANGTSIAATSIVLEDADTGKRYVRSSWFAAYVRQQGGPGAAEEAMRAMPRLGWRKPGKEGRIKATAPGRRATLQWAFLEVPEGWEQA